MSAKFFQFKKNLFITILLLVIFVLPNNALAENLLTVGSANSNLTGTDSAIFSNIGSISATTTSLIRLQKNGVDLFKVDSTGNVTMGNFLTSISAANVSSGAFGSLSGNGNYSFPGNVGIGVSVPVYPLHISSSSADTGLLLQNNTTTLNNSASLRFLVSTSASPSNEGARLIFTRTDSPAAADGDLSFWTRGSGVPTERMRITSNGNVGIGNTAPSQKLAVSGSLLAYQTLSASDFTGLTIGRAGSWSSYIGKYANIAFTNSNSASNLMGAIGLTYDGTGYARMDFHSFYNGVYGATGPLMSIRGSGNVGIGTTAPNRRLDLGGGTNGRIYGIDTATNAVFTDSEVVPKKWIVDNFAPAVGGASLWATSSAGIYNVGLGNVGIGTTSPAYKLDISGGVARQSGYLVADAATDNLVVNGDFEMGDKYGWNGGTVVTGGYSGNYALQLTGYVNLASDDYIPVDPTRDIFQLDAWVKKTVAGTTPGALYFGYYAYDANKTVITTAPCGTYCYFAASGYTIPVDGAWHKVSATTVGEGTSFPNFPVGTKYVRIMGLVNYGGSADTVTSIDHISLKRLVKGPLIAGNNFSSSNLTDHNQYSTLYTTSANNLIINPPSSGNVGIGTTAPNRRLDLGGGTNGRIYGIDTATNAVFTDSEVVPKKWIVDNFAPAVGGASLWATSSAGIYNVGLGNVGIGTTNPGAKIHVVGNGTSFAGVFQNDQTTTTWSSTYTAFNLANANTTANNHALFSFSDNTGVASTAGVGAKFTDRTNHYGDLYFYTKGTDGYNQRLYIQSNGNVGIGTTAPNRRLDLGGGTNGRIYGIDTATNAVFTDSEVVPKKWIVDNFAPAVGGASLWATSSAGIYNVGLGNVGIGTTTPSAKLYVNGTSIFNGLATFTQPVVVGAPVLSTHAATKNYVDTSIVGFAQDLNTIGEVVNISYGQKNTLIDAASLDAKYISASRFYPSSAVDVEISSDGGQTWADAGWSDTQKARLFDDSSYVDNPIPHGSTLRVSINYAAAKPIGTFNYLILALGSGGYQADIKVIKVNKTNNYSVTVVDSANNQLTTFDKAFFIMNLGSIIFRTNSNNSYFDKLVVEVTAHTSNPGTYPTMAFRGISLVSNNTTQPKYLYTWDVNKTVTFPGSLIATGNVGIGTTAPNRRLDLGGGTNGRIYGIDTATNAVFTDSEVVPKKWIVDNFAPAVGGASLWATSSAGIYNVGLGNVGIGTTAPNNNLEVRGASGLRISDPANIYRGILIFGNLNNGWNSGIRAYDSGDAEMRIWHANASGQIVLATGYNGETTTAMPTDGLFIDQNKVGIGYASPAAATGKLVVNGNVGIGTTAPNRRLDLGGGTNGRIYGIDTATNAVFTDSEVVPKKWIVDNFAPAVGGASLWATSSAGIYNVGLGNVGIGTTTPEGKLSVYSPIGGENSGIVVRAVGSYASMDYKVSGSGPGLQTGLYQSGEAFFYNSDGGITFYTDTTLGGSGATANLVIKGNGNVGVGTSNPTNKLQIGSNPSSWANNDLVVSNSAGNKAIVMSSDATMSYIWSSGRLDLYGNNNNTMSLSSGNVGIGTTNPEAKLSIKTAGADGTILQAWTEGVDGTEFALYGDFAGSGATGNSLRFGSGIGGAWSSNILTLRGDGNVGIGTTTPNRRLDLGGGTNGRIYGIDTATNAVFTDSEVVPKKWIVDNFAPAVGGASLWATSSAGIYNVGLGNVGIGTTNPGAKLQVSGGKLVVDNTSGTWGQMQIGNTINAETSLTFLPGVTAYGTSPTASYKWNIGAGINGISSSKFGLGRDGSTYLTFDTSGNVGIGTTAPNRRLDLGGGPNGRIYGIDTATNAVFTDSEVVPKKWIVDNFAPAVGGASLWATSSAGIYNVGLGNVGVGTSAPTEKLEVNGTALFDNSVIEGVPGGRIFRNLKTFTTTSSGPGAIVIQTSVPQDSHTFTQTEIMIFELEPENSTCKVNLGGFWSSESNGGFSNLGYTSNCPFKYQIRLARQISTGNVAIILQDVSSNWDYPFVSVLNFAATYGISDDYADNWAINYNTDLSGYTNIDTVPDKTVLGGLVKSTVSGNSYFMGGNVGIGTTTPNRRLDLGGGTNGRIYGIDTATNAVFTDSEVVPKKWIVDNFAPAVGGASLWATSSAGIYNVGLGNVGIGTTTPANADGWTRVLDVYGVSHAKSIVTTNSGIETGTYSHNTGYFGSPAGGIIGTRSNHPLSLITNAASRMTILTSGNVGISSTTPSGLLAIGNYFSISNLGTIYGPTADRYLDLYGAQTNSIVVPKSILTSGGKLGVGTTAPGGKAEIAQNMSDYGTSFTEPHLKLKALNTVDNTGFVGITFDASTSANYGWSSGALRSTNGQSSFVWKYHNNSAAGVEYMRIASNGSLVVDKLKGTGNRIVLADSTGSLYATSTSNVFAFSSSTPLNMNGGDIRNVNKLTVGTIDPLYRIDGTNYSSFAAAIVGGVKEEYLGRVKISQAKGKEYEYRLDFSKLSAPDELWVWRQTVDFSPENVEVNLTPYGAFANIYYIIENEAIIFRADKPVTVSYRLSGKRVDWQNWPTKAKDQQEKPSFIINKGKVIK